MSDNSYSVAFAEATAEYVINLPDAVYEKVRSSVCLLASNPRMGRVYKPDYDAPKPPIPCRRIVVPTTNVELFYHVDDERLTISVLFACDARSDPMRKIWRIGG